MRNAVWIGAGIAAGAALGLGAASWSTRGNAELRMPSLAGRAPSPGAQIRFDPPTKRPNFLVMIADDYGQDQVGAYGVHPRPPPSPRIDALAAQGVLFRNAFANPVCSPTRATLLTGRYAYRYGIGSAIPPKKGWGLPSTERTLPVALREGAASDSDGTYTSAIVGKWHLATPDMGGLDHARQAGFDHHYGTMGNLLGNVYGTDLPMTFYHWSKVEDGVASEQTTYITTVTVDDAIRFARELPEPWFILVAFNLVHYPQHVPPAELFKAKLTEHPTETELYRVMAEALDSEVGRLVDGVDPRVLAHTEVLFLGDNGTAPVGVVEPFHKSSSKGELNRGGVAVPFIWLGPSVKEPGRTTDAIINTSDVFATVLDLAHIDGPRPEDSVSFASQLQEPGASSARRYAYTEHFSPNGMGPYTSYAASIRDDRYTLVFVDGKPDQLYDNADDPLEMKNLIRTEQPTEEQKAIFKRLKFAFPDAISIEGRPTAEQMAADGVDAAGKLR